MFSAWFERIQVRRDVASTKSSGLPILDPSAEDVYAEATECD